MSMRQDTGLAFGLVCALGLSGLSCSMAPIASGAGTATDERDQTSIGFKQPPCAENHDPSWHTEVLERDPDMRSMTEPVYPEEAKEAKEQGVVWCHVYVDATGRVAKAHVFGHVTPALDQAALDAVKTALYVPAQGKIGVVGTWVVSPVEFRLH